MTPRLLAGAAGCVVGASNRDGRGAGLGMGGGGVTGIWDTLPGIWCLSGHQRKTDCTFTL